MLDNIVLQAEEGNGGAKGDGGCGGGGGHQPHHGAPLQRGEQPCTWGARGRWGAGCRKARLPEAKTQDASGDQASQLPNKTFQSVFQASPNTINFHQGVHKRVIGKDQLENGQLDQRLRISTKGNYCFLHTGSGNT